PPADAPPVSDRVAAPAAAYLIDGYTADEVAERLGVHRGWCRAIAARLRGRRWPMPDQVTASSDEEPVECEDCGRPLRTPRARAERVGPKCRRKRLAMGGAA
ncbi:DUF6011 domain-containing protein, partial [Micromonospora sp. NPDC000018]|uniref:DUF6011 domain-containing protein n=1 Tax=Micromonospora sp. NPDC000018 TaxID=3154239 RepID=UPI0033165B08